MKLTRVLTVLLVILGCGWAAAVPPAYNGPLGNPEEPALRPYKWMWRGFKALVYQTANHAKEGNLKTPILGTAEAFRGFRKGIVEFDESTFRGMVGAVPPQAGIKEYQYDQLLKANQYIDNDVLLRNVADYVATAYAMGIIMGDNGVLMDDFSRYLSPVKLTGTAISFPHNGDDALYAAAYIWAAMKLVDRYPIEPNWKQIDERAEQLRAEKRALRNARDLDRRLYTPRQRAQKSYVGDRIPITPKDPYSGNLLKMDLPD